MSAVDMNMVYKSVLEADRAAVVICDLNHNLEGTLPKIGEANRWTSCPYLADRKICGGDKHLYH